MDILQNELQTHPQICFRQRWGLTPDVHFMLGQGAAIVRSLMYLPLSPEIREQMLRVSLVKGAMSTTAIEGNTLSEEEVAAIQRGDADIPPSRKYQEREVKNVLDALNAVREDVLGNRLAPPVTSELVRALHAQIGKDLGPEFQAVPGQFRPHEVTVGAYRPPDHRAVPAMMDRLCAWLRDFFAFAPDAPRDFRATVVEAIVAHVYLVWLHPFGDGNGRTARLLEFFILLRGGFPDICSHILSNHYNSTRPEYYRHLAEAGRTGDLSGFIAYAVTGLLDGLDATLGTAQRQQIRYCWQSHVSSTLAASKLAAKPVARLRAFLESLDPFAAFKPRTLLQTSPKAAFLYARLSSATLVRDLDYLVGARLLEKRPDDSYAPNLSAIVPRLPAAHAIRPAAG